MNKLLFYVLMLFVIILLGCSHSRNVRRNISNQTVKREDLKQERGENAVQKTFYGRASFYGADFHGKKTASGDVFDMNALTAAHKKLPFDTRCKITNLENNKSVIVRINDRGPFVKDRIIDLSLGAAKALDAVRSGVFKVKIDVLSYPDKK